MDKYETRRLALRSLADNLGKGSIASIAKAIGKDPSYVSRCLYPEGKDGRKRIGEDTWDLLLTTYPTLGGEPQTVAIEIKEHKGSRPDEQFLLDLFRRLPHQEQKRMLIELRYKVELSELDHQAPAKKA